METQEENMNNKEISASKKVFEYLTIITHVFIVGFVLTVIYLCLTNEFVLFTWHPVLLATGWFLLMTEGILILTTNNPLTKGLSLSHKFKVQCHWIIQAVGVTFSVIGFIVIYINKNIKDKPHFHSWHAIGGLICVLCCIPTCLSGMIALYNFIFKDYVAPVNSKFAHRCCGVVTFVVGSVTVLLSLYTMWFQRNVTGYLIVIWFIIILFVSVWSISQASVKVCRRLKAIVL